MNILSKTTVDTYFAECDLSEAGELYLRHARIWVETVAIATETKTLFVSRVCELPHEINLLLETDKIDASELTVMAYVGCDTMLEVGDLYAKLIAEYQSDVSV